MLQAELKQDKLSSSTLTETLASYKSDLLSKEAKMKELQVDLTAANRQVRLLELQVSKTDETCLELREEKKRILQQVKILFLTYLVLYLFNFFCPNSFLFYCSVKLDETQRSLQRLEVNSNVLKETCTMLEEQLEDFERLTSTHEAKEARLHEECSKLHVRYFFIPSSFRISMHCSS